VPTHLTARSHNIEDGIIAINKVNVYEHLEYFQVNRLKSAGGLPPNLANIIYAQLLANIIYAQSLANFIYAQSLANIIYAQ
jgi:hypothetical protein